MLSSTPPPPAVEKQSVPLVLPSCQKLFEEVEVREEARFASLPRSSQASSPPAPFSFAFGPLSSASSAYTTWKEDQQLRRSVSSETASSRSSRTSPLLQHGARPRVVPYVPLASLHTQEYLPQPFKPRALEQSERAPVSQARLPSLFPVPPPSRTVSLHSNTYFFNRRLPPPSTSVSAGKPPALPEVSVKTPPLIAPLTNAPPFPSLSNTSPPLSPSSVVPPPSNPSIKSKARRRKPSSDLPKNKYCPHCDSVFARKNDLTRHIYIHTDERCVPSSSFDCSRSPKTDQRGSLIQTMALSPMRKEV